MAKLSGKIKALLASALLVPAYQFYASSAHEKDVLAKAGPTMKIDLAAQAPKIVTPAQITETPPPISPTPEPIALPSVDLSVAREPAMAQTSVPALASSSELAPVLATPLGQAAQTEHSRLSAPFVWDETKIDTTTSSPLSEGGLTSLYLNLNERYSLRFTLASNFDQMKLSRERLRLKDFEVDDRLLAFAQQRGTSFVEFSSRDWMLVSSEKTCLSQANKTLSRHSLRVTQSLAADDCFVGQLTDIRVLRKASMAPARAPASVKKPLVRAYVTRKSAWD